MSKYQDRVSHFEKVRNGYFGLSYSYCWVAYDAWGNTLASASTKAECIKNCRYKGIIVPKYAI